MNCVLLITNDFPPRPGGIQTYLENLCGLLTDTQVVVLTSQWKSNEDTRYDLESDWEIHRYPTTVLLPTPGVISQARELIDRYQPRTVWFGAAAPLAVMSPWMRYGSVQRVVASTHGHEVGWGMLPGARQSLRIIGQHCDEISYVSTYTRDRFAAAFGPAARLVKLSPGVATHVVNDRKSYNSTDSVTVLCLSRLVPRKGQDTLISLWPSILQRCPHARLVIAGGGPYRSSLESMIADRQLQDSVTMLGRIEDEDMASTYEASDIFAMPCRTRGKGLDVEGLGIVFLEAAAAGLPVIAGNSGGAGETVDHGRTGFVVDGQNDQQLRHALITLIEDADLRGSFGQAGQNWVQKHWLWSSRTDSLTQFLFG